MERTIKNDIDEPEYNFTDDNEYNLTEIQNYDNLNINTNNNMNRRKDFYYSHKQNEKKDNINHTPNKMNFNKEKNFLKPNSSIIESSNKNKINVDPNKEKYRYFVPWRRAEQDPSLVKKGSEIHINLLPPNTTHEELYNFFKGYGEIIDIRLIPRKDKGTSFAFIRFLEVNNAMKTLREKCLKFKENILKISKSKEETTIFIGNIKKHWTEKHLETIIKERIPSFDELRFFPDSNNPGKNRGYCFLKLNNPLLARVAYEKLCRNIILDGASVTVDWADEFDSANDVNKVQIHLSGINEMINTEDLYTVFGQYGEIINIKLSRDLEGKDRKDYGFITFSKEEDASRAVNEFNWKEYFDTPLNVQLARKMSSILKHKQKIKGDMLERKRRRDNVFKNQKKYENSESEEEEDPNLQNSEKIMKDFTKLLNNLNSNNSMNQLMGQMINFISNNINTGNDLAFKQESEENYNSNISITNNINDSNINENKKKGKNKNYY